MNTLFPSLLSKTLFIVCFQLLFVMIGSHLVLSYFRKKYEEGVPWIKGEELPDGKIDLTPDVDKVKGLLGKSLIINIIMFFVLIFSHTSTVGTSPNISDIIIPLILFFICAITDGITIGCFLIIRNEHLASKAIKLTLCAVIITMLLTCVLGLDFSFLLPIALIALIILVIINFIRIFKTMSKGTERRITIFGIILFIGYLLIDFSIIMNNEAIYEKDWGAALSLAIDIYLDVINLFLYILQFLGD